MNVNTAPRAVLLALPGLTDANVDAIIAKRPQYQGGATPDDQFKTIALVDQRQHPPTTNPCRHWNATSRPARRVYRVQSIGYFDEGGPMARVEAVIDANQGKPRVVYYTAT